MKWPWKNNSHKTNYTIRIKYPLASYGFSEGKKENKNPAVLDTVFILQVFIFPPILLKDSVPGRRSIMPRSGIL